MPLNGEFAIWRRARLAGLVTNLTTTKNPIVVVHCKDARYVVPTFERMGKLIEPEGPDSAALHYGVPCVFPHALFGGPIQLSRRHEKSSLPFDGILRELSIMGNMKGGPIELLLVTHPDCSYRTQFKIGLRETLERLQVATADLQTMLPSYVSISSGIHIRWDEGEGEVKDRTYAFDPGAIMDFIAAESLVPVS